MTSKSPERNLVNGVIFVCVIIVLGTGGYMAAGWDISDAFYMVIITIFSVGYDEVHPVDSGALRALTVSLIVLGCTGMIYLTGALVQFFTAAQLQQLLGLKKMKNEIDHLQGHVIICGFGRIGTMLARDLRAGNVRFVVIERNEERTEQARELGYLYIHGEATDEQTLIHAGIARAGVVATVLPDDAANVFITLSARSLNKSLRIIARGELPTTESKLVHAGADQVVLPAHIGAERIAEIILYPESARMIRNAERMGDFGLNLHKLGLDLSVVAVAQDSKFAGLNIEEIERQSAGAFLIVAINRSDGSTITRPAPDTRIAPGDGVVIIERAGRSASEQDAFAGTKGRS